MGWLLGWNYRKSITLSRSSGAVTNYQMKLLVGESSGASGESVDCGAKCLTNFNDIRFTTSDGTTLLDYWIESITGTTPNQLATIWIEFNSIGTSSTIFYMYYGNATAGYYSNGDNTFLFFDDFSGSFPGTKWTNNTSYFSVTNGILTGSTTNGTATSGTSTHSGNICLRTRSRIQSSNYCGMFLLNSTDGMYLRYNSATSPTSECMTYINNWETYSKVSTSLLDYTSYHIFELKRISGIAYLYYDETSQGSSSTGVSSGSLGAGLSDQILCDWILIRKIESTEPSWGTWGNEELKPPNVFYSHIYGYLNFRGRTRDLPKFK